MDMIKAFVFVQGFIWASLLFRKPSRQLVSMAAAFLFLCLLYLILYINTVFERQIPVILAPAFTMLLSVSLSFHPLKKWHLRLKEMEFNPVWFLLAASALLVAYCIWTRMPAKLCWMYVTLLGAATFAVDAYAFMKHLKKKTIAGSLLEDPWSRLSMLLLLDKGLVLLFACFIFFFPVKNEDSYPAMRNSMDILVTLLTFVTGYMTVTALFTSAAPEKRKKQKKVEDENTLALIAKVNRLMQDQKPYLDHELTLDKMADMLELSENELTRLLNHEMETNFYALVNDYRMETVLEKLKVSDNRKFTIMASAYESGFNSKSTFYRIFKEYTKLTPKEYLAEN
jgi:AraC-like DNA-binding protein